MQPFTTQGDDAMNDKNCNWCLKALAACGCNLNAAAPKMITVFVETPYAGDIERNLRYLRACMRDCLLRGEAPFASHGLYTQAGVLRDEVPEERKLGIEAGFALRRSLHKTVFYTDLGFSTGMKYGVADAESFNHPIEYRQLGGEWASCGAV
jgi:hypothetical protein